MLYALEPDFYMSQDKDKESDTSQRLARGGAETLALLWAFCWTIGIAIVDVRPS